MSYTLQLNQLDDRLFIEFLVTKFDYSAGILRLAEAQNTINASQTNTIVILIKSWSNVKLGVIAIDRECPEGHSHSD
jgi:hypothetical protein